MQHVYGQIDKFDDLNFPIIAIELDNKGSAYVLNNTGKIYHLDLYGWGHQQVPKNSKQYKFQLKNNWANNRWYKSMGKNNKFN
ncbi:hypothetical protein [Spiroplasma citri]|uniref:hypothetical protein n=1 Tax=Spiroplasma citri TaxID=2133 RepID=UPI001EE2726D|nr:hypothetical protein [Spiroplasma citri]